MRTDRYDRVGQVIDCSVKDEWMDAAAPVKLHTPRALRVRAKTFFLKGGATETPPLPTLTPPPY